MVKRIWAVHPFQEVLEFVLQGLVAGHRHGNAFHPLHLRIENITAPPPAKRAGRVLRKPIVQAARQTQSPVQEVSCFALAPAHASGKGNRAFI